MKSGVELLYYLDQVGQGHYGTAYDEVVLALLFFSPQVLGVAILQTDGAAHLLRHAYLLARTVDELELCLGEQDGKGDAGEPSAGAEVENPRAWPEVDALCYRQGVEHVMLIQIVDVLSGYYVDLRVPVAV